VRKVVWCQIHVNFATRARSLLSLENIVLRWLLGGIDQITVGLQSRRGGHARFFHVARSENVKHALAGREEVVGDDPSVTAPPHGFRAHDSATPRVSELAQIREPITKMIAQGVVGIVVKTVVFPERVEPARHLARAAAQASERRDVLISDFERLKRLGQGVTVKLRIGARARHGADVDNER
jgi:hypothetical protein